MKILLVDDNKFILAVAKEYLEEIPGISAIYICSDPNKVKKIIDENDIDILILDIIMPVITGLDLLKMLRSDEKYNDMPIIMLTSLDDTDNYQRCFDLGAFDYINKPINAVEFNSRLKVAIESKRNSNHLKSLVEYTQKQNEELMEINTQLKAAKSQLVQTEKMAAIGQLAAGIAHEINNPMGYVSSNYDILRKYYTRIYDFLNYLTLHLEESPTDDNHLASQLLNELKQKYSELKIAPILDDFENLLSDSENGIQRVNEITQSLRIFTRSAKDDEKAFYPLIDIFRQVILLSRNEVKYVAKIETDIPKDINLYCNRIQIGQVLVNILVNAAQAIQSQKRGNMGLIKITGRKSGKNIIIIIENNGPEIPKEHLIRIFEPFYTTKVVGQGTGLGLSISYDIIVNKHSGFIEATSEPGKGVTFTIILPVIATM
ncbi:MAG: response regulator receiver sensor signal transduction histidine kinase [Herbinix sp.]|jgi:signal transduction histidine kinase|nr:response regulator receiver sensor signal transduction histidine kinase [Herbinix sp.]